MMGADSENKLALPGFKRVRQIDDDKQTSVQLIFKLLSRFITIVFMHSCYRLVTDTLRITFVVKLNDCMFLILGRAKRSLNNFCINGPCGMLKNAL